MNRKYELNAPQGVASRKLDNIFIQKVLKWESSAVFVSQPPAHRRNINTGLDAKCAK